MKVNVFIVRTIIRLCKHLALQIGAAEIIRIGVVYVGIEIGDNVELHTALAGLKTLVKDYYNSEIVPVLFEYEFIK